MIKPDYFELIFRNWVKRVCLEVKGVVAIDGKLMRGPSQCDGEHTPLLVRAPVNSFEFQPCGRTPQAECLMR